MSDPENRNIAGQDRSAARLGAVQALYQLDMDADTNVDQTVSEFLRLRLGQEVDGETYATADGEFFEDVVRGVSGRKQEFDELLKAVLTKTWTVDRVERILKCIIRSAIYELIARPDVPTKVILNEYLDVTHSFYGGAEPGFVNGVLDRLAKDIRP